MIEEANETLNHNQNAQIKLIGMHMQVIHAHNDITKP